MFTNICQGFVPYFNFDHAEEGTFSNRRKFGDRRSHASSEVRNFICAQMKRNDPVSRRFIQYTSMQSRRMLILVRDGKTGSILVQPPTEELWLVRRKFGWGRAARAEWETLRAVGPDFFEEMDRHRSFHLGFDDFYDIYIWSTDPGIHWQVLHTCVIQVCGTLCLFALIMM